MEKRVYKNIIKYLRLSYKRYTELRRQLIYDEDTGELFPFTTTFKIKPSYGYWLQRRIAVMDRQAEFLLVNKLQFSGLCMTVVDPPHRRGTAPRDLVSWMRGTLRYIILDFIRPFRLMWTTGRWTGARSVSQKQDRIPTLLFITPSHRGNRGDDAMYEVTRRAFTKEVGPIRAFTFIHRDLTPEESRETDFDQPEILFSLNGLLRTAHPMVRCLGRGAGGVAARFAQIFNIVRPSNRRLRVHQIRSTAQVIVYGGWFLLNTFLFRRFRRTWCLFSLLGLDIFFSVVRSAITLLLDIDWGEMSNL